MVTLKIVCLFEAAITPSLGRIPLLNVEYNLITASKDDEAFARDDEIFACSDSNSELYFSNFMQKGDFLFTSELKTMCSLNLKGIKISSRYNSKLSLLESATFSQAFEFLFVHLSGEFSTLENKSGKTTL